MFLLSKCDASINLRSQPHTTAMQSRRLPVPGPLRPLPSSSSRTQMSVSCTVYFDLGSTDIVLRTNLQQYALYILNSIFHGINCGSSLYRAAEHWFALNDYNLQRLCLPPLEIMPVDVTALIELALSAARDPDTDKRLFLQLMCCPGPPLAGPGLFPRPLARLLRTLSLHRHSPASPAGCF